MRRSPPVISLCLLSACLATVGCEGKRETPKPLKIALPSASPTPAAVVLYADIFRRRLVPPGTDTNIDRVQTALAKHPKDPKAQRAVGLAYYAAGGYEAAIKTLEPLHNTDPEAQAYLGFAHMGLGNHEQALVCLKGLGLQSKLPKPLLSAVRLEQGNLAFQVVKQDAEAEACYNAALALSPTGEGYLALGLLKASQSKTKEAQDALQRAAALLPAGKLRAAAFVALGRLEGDPAKARAWYEKTRKDDPENPWLKKLSQ